MKLILWEIYSYVHIPIIWFLFKRFGKKDVSGSLIAGSVIGLFLEFATEPLWIYHFKFTFYKDIAPSIVMGWGVLFTLVVEFSEKLYRVVLQERRVRMDDTRLFVFDVIAACVIAFPMETMGLKSGVWDYNYPVLNWSWGTVPVFQMPYEALVGYMLLMLVAPSFVRRWRGPFTLKRRSAKKSAAREAIPLRRAA